ncbi:MAG TPA: DUF2142 domain-containing protein [Chloroflexi bacterium]|nr:DUF2142 domain-containing protein [Chloroflexota bacterium]
MRRFLVLILLTFFVVGVGYSLLVPPFEASDELWHYPMVKYIADHWALPVQEPGVETPWRQEGSQPPLYYALMAAATFWIDTSDMPEVRHLNPHVDNGVATLDGNINLVVHHPEREGFPWRGAVLALHLIRLLSVLMGVAAVYLTYLIAREVFPERPDLALGAAAVHAFIPLVVFIAGSVNNDNLVVPLSSLALLMLLRLLRRPSLEADPRSSLVAYLALGVVLGLAALTKSSSLALALLTALVVTVRALRGRSWTEFLVGGAATALPLLLVAGWWFLRNWQLYGDPLGLNVFKIVLGTREIPADLAQLWRERYSFAAGYWGNFGGLNIPMPAWVYAALNGTAIVAALGLVIAAGRAVVESFIPGKPDDGRKWPSLDLPLLICVLWGLGVFLPWALSWARETWSSQGRLIFSALPTWSLLLALGLTAWLPRHWGRWVLAAFALFLLGLTVIAPFAWIRPAYALPPALTERQIAAIPHRVDVDFGANLRLLGYDLEAQRVQPGGQVAVTLYWEALAPTDRDHTVFVHLLGEGELLVAQRDTFPGLGLLSTTRLKPGESWADRYVLLVPGTAYTPDEAQIEVGVYDPTTGDRLPVRDAGGRPLGDNVRFGKVVIQPRAGDLPHPIAVNFGDRMALVGYDLDRRVLHPGEEVTLTLYWEGLRPMDENYNVSVQFIDAAQRKAAQRDGWPVDGAAPTGTWQPGQVVTDIYPLVISPDAAAAVYDVRVVAYLFDAAAGEILHLPVTPEGGRMQSKQVTLTTVRVLP